MDLHVLLAKYIARLYGKLKIMSSVESNVSRRIKCFK